MRPRAVTRPHPRPPLHAPAPAGAKLLPLGEAELALPAHAEVVHIPFERGAPYPGLFVFTEASRRIALLCFY